MNGSSRRILSFWLLLLLPTVAVGAAALWLVWREHVRQEQRTALVDEARRTALLARGQLVAENVQLLVGDVQSALLDTLSSVAEEELPEFLTTWKSEQPLVQTVFQAKVDGTLLRPTMSLGDEEERGFARRFAALFRTAPPWRSTVAAERSRSLAASETLNRVDLADEVRTQAELNSYRVQSARQEVKSIARKRSTFSSESAPSSAADRSAPKSIQAEGGISTEGKRGWKLEMIDGRSHLLGWIEGPSIRGVEMNMVSLLGRLGGAMPEELGAGEGLLLRDERGRAWHQVGTVPRDSTSKAIEVPLASASLPGWSIVGYLDEAPYSVSRGRNFALIGGGIILVMVFSILVGGSRLLWQAHRSEEDARLKTSFVANVSHEFKTPLTTIRLYSELLEQGRVGDEEKRRDYLNTIGRETQRLARLVNNVLDFSRLEQGRKKYEIQKVEMSSLITRLASTLQPRVDEAGIQLRTERVDEEVTVSADRDAVEQILLNLVDNAVKYAAEGKEITLELRKTVSGCEVDVKDRGPGIPVPHREKIFDKFHRVDDTLTAERSGAGLGLSIARQLARGMGGDLRVATRKDGAGSVFTLLIQ